MSVEIYFNLQEWIEELIDILMNIMYKFLKLSILGKWHS